MTTSPRMAAWKTLLIAFAITAAVWLAFAWPVPRFFSSGIPCSAVNSETRNYRSMISGDHLQLLYNYWLFSDMLAGNTPWFHNLYEFNTGNDSLRRNPGPYNMPFSLVYSAGAAIGGRAFGWNLTQFMVLWLTYWLCWRLAARLASNELIAAVAALAGLAVPYRWISLLGGSPTGFAIIWIPLILLGIDRMTRDGSIAGGIMAGVGVYMAMLNDKHVFLFGFGMIPVWLALAFALGAKTNVSTWRRIAAFMPFILLSFMAIQSGLSSGEKLAGTTMAAGRDISVVRLFSPGPADFLKWLGEGRSPHVYIGFTLIFLLAAGGGIVLAHAFLQPDQHWRTFVAASILFFTLGVVLILSLGPNGPFDGIAFKACRRIFSPLRMIRQPDKIFCVMPALLAGLLAVVLPELVGVIKKRTVAVAILLAAAGALVAENAPQIRPQVCLLSDEQAAYKAVADDAAARNEKAHAAVFPLWPGDSHWASLYEYYVSLYRIRMINGYRPAIDTNYLETVSKRYASGNQGELTDGQLDELRAMGVTHVIFHEDAYPEQVGPFAVGFTLKRLLNHPRLELLRESRGIWAFSVLAEPAGARPELGAGWRSFFPARRWEAEDSRRCRTARSITVNDPSCGGQAYVALSNMGAMISFPTSTLSHAEGLGWLVRARGNATLQADIRTGGPIASRTLTLDAPDWQWLRIDTGAYSGRQTLSLALSVVKGNADVDTAMVVAGEWNTEPEPGRPVILPGPSFFHAGSTDLESDSVIFRKDEEPSGSDFYGPCLPLPPGTYTVEVDFTCAIPGARLGHFFVSAGKKRSPDFEVVNGRPAVGRITIGSNLPARFVFVYSREADIAIRKVIFTRLP